MEGKEAAYLAQPSTTLSNQGDLATEGHLELAICFLTQGMHALRLQKPSSPEQIKKLADSIEKLHQLAVTKHKEV